MLKQIQAQQQQQNLKINADLDSGKSDRSDAKFVAMVVTDVVWNSIKGEKEGLKKYMPTDENILSFLDKGNKEELTGDEKKLFDEFAKVYESNKDSLNLLKIAKDSIGRGVFNDENLFMPNNNTVRPQDKGKSHDVILKIDREKGTINPKNAELFSKGSYKLGGIKLDKITEKGLRMLVDYNGDGALDLGYNFSLKNKKLEIERSK